MKRHLSIASILFAITFLPAAADATSISVGSAIAVSPTTIAVPIEIKDGLAVAGWQFDLAFDATDLQVNTGCDPFSGDIYCSLNTGPVTEGDFFASGVPFNLLIPGFVDLDPITMNQTGLLFGAAGTFGGSAPPYPSGDGTLAFVEFTILGTGRSQIRVVNSSIDEVAVPEPATLLLVLGGLPFIRSRRSSCRLAREASLSSSLTRRTPRIVAGASAAAALCRRTDARSDRHSPHSVTSPRRSV